MWIQSAGKLDEKHFKEFFETLESNEFKLEFIRNIPFSKSYTRKEIVHKLATYYKNRKLVLVLGAGVSMDFGLPNWETLLQELMMTTMNQEQKVASVLSKSFTNIFSPSPLIAGRYLQNHYAEKQLSFEEAIRKVLYKELDIKKQSELMDEIINFCIGQDKSQNLDSIITYNFDDILEQRLSKANNQFPYKSIYGIGMNPYGQLPIFHVHGFLQQKGKLTDQNQITFGESVYHKQYNDIYSWNNFVQINKFRDSNCLFIGSSLTDPNIRRLLDIAKKQKGDSEEDFHFVFKLRYREEAIKVRLESLLKENQHLLNEKSLAKMNFEETVKFLIDIIERFDESDTASFGVKTIWINDWKEIPEIMREARLQKIELPLITDDPASKD
jgi:NAD-dependent SIR2 family protein deacetylase